MGILWSPTSLLSNGYWGLFMCGLGATEVCSYTYPCPYTDTEAQDTCIYNEQDIEAYILSEVKRLMKVL